MRIEEEQYTNTIAAVLRNRFLEAVKGDIIKHVDMDNNVHYLALASRNVPEKGINQKVYTLYNLTTGYVWRDGGITLSEAFDKYFTDSNGVIKIKDLVVYHNSRLLLN